MLYNIYLGNRREGGARAPARSDLAGKMLFGKLHTWEVATLGKYVTSILNTYIYFACLSVCLFLYPRNVKTAEPIGLKFCVGPHVAPGKINE